MGPFHFTPPSGYTPSSPPPSKDFMTALGELLERASSYARIHADDLVADGAIMLDGSSNQQGYTTEYKTAMADSERLLALSLFVKGCPPINKGS